MKKLTITVLALFAIVSVFAQTPHAIKYQTIVRDNTGGLVQNQNISFLIRIVQGHEFGPSVYNETHSVITNEFGLVNLNIGNGSVMSGDFSTIEWGNDSFYLRVEMDIAGGTDYTLMGVTQLLAVPYSLFSEKSGDGYWIKVADNIYYDAGLVGIGTTSPTEQLEITGNFKLPESSDSLEGVMRKGDLRFFHDFAPVGSNYNNIFIGKNAGNFSMYTDGLVNHASDNIGIGTKVLMGNTTGYENTAMGSQSLMKNTSGHANTSAGFLSMYENTEGYRNAAFGRSSLMYNTTGYSNTAIGAYALYLNNSGWQNTSVGVEASERNVTGSQNVSLGYRAMFSNYYGSNNVAIGFLAGMGTGDPSIVNIGNVIIGAESGTDMANGADYNTLVGYRAGFNISSGSNNILIGANTDPPAPTDSDMLNIGDVIFGDLVSGNIGIGLPAPSTKLAVGGNVEAAAYFGDGSYLTGVHDNMGDHQATQNINLSGNWLSGDGYNEGVYIDNSGNVGINNSLPVAMVDAESPGFNAQLVSGSSALYGLHYISGSYGSIGSYNVGLLGYSQNGYALQATTQDGYAIYGASTGTGYGGYFLGKGYFSGNLGLGVDDPLTRLHVNGTVTATLYIGDGSGLTNLTGDNLGNHSSTQNLRLNSYWLSGDGGNEGIFVNSTGKVGIGTNAPGDCILDVHGNINMNVEDGQGMSFRMRENDEHRWTFLYRPWVNSTLTILDEVGSKSVMVFEPNTGHIGINNTNPEVPIHIIGGSDASPSSGGHLITGNTSAYNIVMDNDEIMARYNNSPSNLLLNYNGGKVGISCIPSNLLDVEGTGTSNGGVTGYNEVTGHFKNDVSGHSAISVDALTDQDAVIYLSENGTAMWSIRTDVSEDNGYTVQNVLEFRDHNGGLNQEIFRMYYDDLVGVYMIRPHGFIMPSLPDEYWCGTNGLYWNEVHSHYYIINTPMDNFKNVSSLDYGLKEVLKLNPITYIDDKNESGQPSIALNPVEVASIIPEITMKPKKNEDGWGLKYDELIPVLINAIQDQQEQIEELKLKLNNLNID